MVAYTTVCRMVIFLYLVSVYVYTQVVDYMPRDNPNTGGFMRTRRSGVVTSLFVYMVSFGALNLLFWISSTNKTYLCR
jgi:hypothetical protein